jgi:hypothetical protein
MAALIPLLLVGAVGLIAASVYDSPSGRDGPSGPSGGYDPGLGSRRTPVVPRHLRLVKPSDFTNDLQSGLNGGVATGAGSVAPGSAVQAPEVQSSVEPAPTAQSTSPATSG